VAGLLRGGSLLLFAREPFEVPCHDPYVLGLRRGEGQDQQQGGEDFSHGRKFLPRQTPPSTHLARHEAKVLLGQGQGVQYQPPTTLPEFGIVVEVDADAENVPVRFEEVISIQVWGAVPGIRGDRRHAARDPRFGHHRFRVEDLLGWAVGVFLVPVDLLGSFKDRLLQGLTLVAREVDADLLAHVAGRVDQESEMIRIIVPPAVGEGDRDPHILYRKSFVRPERAYPHEEPCDQGEDGCRKRSGHDDVVVGRDRAYRAM